MKLQRRRPARDLPCPISAGSTPGRQAQAVFATDGSAAGRAGQLASHEGGHSSGASASRCSLTTPVISWLPAARVRRRAWGASDDGKHTETLSVPGFPGREQEEVTHQVVAAAPQQTKQGAPEATGLSDGCCHCSAPALINLMLKVSQRDQLQELQEPFRHLRAPETRTACAPARH